MVPFLILLGKRMCISNVHKEKMQQIKSQNTFVNMKAKFILTSSYITWFCFHISVNSLSVYFDVRSKQHVLILVKISRLTAYLNKPEESCQPESLRIEAICIAYVPDNIFIIQSFVLEV